MEEQHVEGAVVDGRLRGFKATAAKYNSKGECTTPAMLVATVELPSHPSLARHLAKLTQANRGLVELTMETKPPDQEELPGILDEVTARINRGELDDGEHTVRATGQ